MDTEKMIEAKKAYDEWYKKACRMALAIGQQGTTVSGKEPDADGNYSPPVVTMTNGFSFTPMKPACE